MFIKYFFTFVQDKPIVSISVRIFKRTLFLVEYFLKLLSMNVKMKFAAVVQNKIAFCNKFRDKTEEHFDEFGKLLIQYYYVFNGSGFLADIPLKIL